MFKTLKSSPMLWAGVALVAYGLFLAVTGGLTLKAMVAVGAGIYVFSQKVSPVVFNKIKDMVISRVKAFIHDLINNTADNIMSDKSPTEAVESVVKTNTVVTREECFKREQQDAITYLATEAKLAGNMEAVEQVRKLNDQFFTISVNKINNEASDEKPVV
jgi:hypothetical protein